MSAFRDAMLRLGYGEWAVDTNGALVRVARIEPLTLVTLPRRP